MSMNTTDGNEQLVKELAHAMRVCEVCFEQRRVLAKVGPFLLKEPCKNGCAGGYVKRERKENR